MKDPSPESNPLVSAVVTTYDRPELCKRAVRSVQAQTYDPVETLVIEDGTESDVQAWLNAEMPDVQYVRHANNRGLAAARNTGLEKANGEWVAYLDDDDKWKPERVERQIAKLNALDPELRSNVGVVYCGTEQRTPEGQVLSINHPESRGELRASIQDIGASTLPSTFLFSREALHDVGGFDESLSSSIDHDIWMSLATRGYRVVPVDEPLVISYETDQQSMVTNTYNRIEGVEQYVRKWTPTYQEWFGDDEGIRYRNRYFTHVIARVVEAKIRRGAFSEAWDAAQAILRVTDRDPYSLRFLKNTVVKAIQLEIEERFPEPVVAGLRQFKRSFVEW